MSATLHRCRTPTNWLCPCGRVARELRRRGIEFEEHRVDWRKRDRDEIDALTGQRHVPVLVDEIDALTGQRHVPVLVLGREVICDSVRIVEHLRWRDATAATSPSA